MKRKESKDPVFTQEEVNQMPEPQDRIHYQQFVPRSLALYEEVGEEFVKTSLKSGDILKVFSSEEKGIFQSFHVYRPSKDKDETNELFTSPTNTQDYRHGFIFQELAKSCHICNIMELIEILTGVEFEELDPQWNPKWAVHLFRVL